MSAAMQWSWSLGRLFGIETRVHATFVLVLLWAFWGSYAGGPLAVAVSLAFLLAVFASVVAHEFGHALTARAFGIGTRQILLLPIGGVAQIDGARMAPRQELLVALAGPLVSFALAGTFFTLGAVTGDVSPHGFVGAIAWANLGLALFNLIPAFPMDGGRVFRALLAERLGTLRATEIAAAVGKVAAVGFGLYGLATGRTFLALLAVFLYLAARSEAALAARLGRHDDEVPPRFWSGPSVPRRPVRRVIIVRRGFWN